MLNGAKYQVTKLGKKFATLHPLIGQSQLIGLPSHRVPFLIHIQDLAIGIELNIYTIN